MNPPERSSSRRRQALLSAEALFEEHRDTLRWEWVAGHAHPERHFAESAIAQARSAADLIGYLNYMALTKMVQTISDGPARDTLETVLRKERWYWGRRKTERESRKAYKKVMGMVLLGNGKIGVYRH